MCMLFPTLQDLMADPVVLSDGFSYERAALEKWLIARNSSPMTNMQLTTKVNKGSSCLGSRNHNC